MRDCQKDEQTEKLMDQKMGQLKGPSKAFPMASSEDYLKGNGRDYPRFPLVSMKLQANPRDCEKELSRDWQKLMPLETRLEVI